MAHHVDNEKHGVVNEKGEVELLDYSAVTEGFETLDETKFLTPDERRKLKWKLDTRLLPTIWIVYFVNLLDRVSVGGAAAYGFRRDLRLTGNQYNIGISMFYLFYALSETPSNLCLKKFGGKFWLPFIAILYGICSLGTAFIHTGGQYYVVRILLGITEAGTLPGCTYYLSTYYDRDELSFRLPIFISAGALATAVGSLLAFGYNSIGVITSSIFGWRNIFFINALITFGVAIPAYFILPDTPTTTAMLNERERQFMAIRSRRLTAGLAKEEATKTKLVWRGFTSPVVWFGILPWFNGQIGASALTFFLSIILTEQFGYTGNAANLHVAYCFFLAAGMQPILGYAADKTKTHAPYVIGLLSAGLIGSTIFMYSHNRNARYFGAFLAATGALAFAGIVNAWVASNLAPYTVRAVGLGWQMSVGAMGGVLGAWVFLPAERTRGYPTGRAILITFYCVAIVGTLAHWYYIKWENKQRALGKRDWRLDLPADEIEVLGNLHPHFKLTT